MRLPDRTTDPLVASRHVDVVKAFEFPPGHVEVSSNGRIFVDPTHYGPKDPEFQVAEVVGSDLHPFPPKPRQRSLNRVHSLRLDSKNRLWVNDHGDFGLKTPKIVAYDLTTGCEVFRHQFPKDVAGLGTMLNDLVYDEKRNRAYISNPGPLFGAASILVVDLDTNTSRAVLKKHVSVKAADVDIVVEGKVFRILLMKARLAVDGMLLARDGSALYYAPLNAGVLYRVGLDALNDVSLTPEDLGRSVEKVADITMTDGMAIDEDGRIYLTDVEHSAIVRLETDGKLTTLLKDPRFRWPTNISFAPNRDMYFTCNAVHEVTAKSDRTVRKRGPYPLFVLPAARMP